MVFITEKQLRLFRVFSIPCIILPEMILVTDMKLIKKYFRGADPELFANKAGLISNSREYF